jgi:SAM-dependent methyltransferase
MAEQANRGVASLEASLPPLQEASLLWEMDRSEIRVTTINQELLKGEIRDVGSRLEKVARAVSPAAGLEGVTDAMAEVRERLAAIERQLRFLASQSLTASTGSNNNAETASRTPLSRAENESVAPSSSLFDYVGFERRFRGDPASIAGQLEDRYGDLLVTNPPVLDLGCGRGELLTLLKDKGIPATGVDTDPSMVVDAATRGLDIRHADAVTFLRDQAPGTFGSIIATHLLEHLDLDAMIELLELAATRLRPGGVLIAETPNPASLIVLGNSYILDPTHIRPLHPKLLEFLCEGAGFGTVALRFFAPATGYRLKSVDDPSAPEWAKQINQAFDQLNNVLFGPQDYAVVATTTRNRP